MGNYLIFDTLSVQTETCIVATSGIIAAPPLSPQVLHYDDTGGAPGVCFGGVSNTVGITPIVTDSLIFQIPIVSTL